MGIFEKYSKEVVLMSKQIILGTEPTAQTKEQSIATDLQRVMLLRFMPQLILAKFKNVTSAKHIHIVSSTVSDTVASAANSENTTIILVIKKAIGRIVTCFEYSLPKSLEPAIYKRLAADKNAANL